MEDKNLKQYRYIQFPLCLLRETYRNIRDGMNLIISFGIIHYAKKQKYDIDAVCSQVIYSFYHKQDKLQKSIVRKIQDASKDGYHFNIDPDYKGFDTNGKFNPELNITELKILFKDDIDMMNDCILHYQIHLVTSENHLNIDYNSEDKLIKEYNEAVRFMKSFESLYGKDAMPSCKIELLWDFRDKQKDDIDLFRFYIAIRSVIGRQKFGHSSKPAIVSRMLGLKSKSAFDYYTKDKFNKDKNLLPTVEKYFNNHYNIDKVLNVLVERKLIMYLSKKHVNKIYFSRYMEPEQLRDLINAENEEKNLKKRIREASNGLL